MLTYLLLIYQGDACWTSTISHSVGRKDTRAIKEVNRKKEWKWEGSPSKEATSLIPTAWSVVLGDYIDQSIRTYASAVPSLCHHEEPSGNYHLICIDHCPWWRFGDSVRSWAVFRTLEGRLVLGLATLWDMYVVNMNLFQIFPIAHPPPTHTVAWIILCYGIDVLIDTWHTEAIAFLSSSHWNQGFANRN